MPAVKELIAEAKDLLAQAENDVEKIEERVDPTQLGVAVHRLRLFIEHVGQIHADEPVRKARDEDEAASDDDGSEDLDSLTRKQLDKLAGAEGVNEPEKLANKQAVIDAILEHRQAAGDGEE